MTRCLIDSDSLVYQCSFAGQFKDEQSGELVMKDFTAVEEMLQLKVREILEECMSDEAPLMFLTGDDILANYLNRRPRWLRPREKVELLPSFRYYEAVTKPYKGNRHALKPLHYHNIRAYILSEFECVVSNGVEADDMLAVYLCKDKENILCSIDKDLRQVPGKHYTWSVGNRPSIPVYEVDELGTMELVTRSKLFATGLKSFFAQLIMGDTVDNIQGIPGAGPVLAYNTLNECTTECEMFDRVVSMYQENYEEWEKALREHIDLVWMIRQLDEDGIPIRYKYPKECEPRQGQVDQKPDVEERGQKRSS